MKVLNISSGATKFIGLVGCTKQVYDSGYKPDIVTGVSSGAIISLLSVLGFWDQMIKKGLELKLNDFFSISPVSSKGKIRLTRALLKHGSLGEQRIQKLLKEYITERLFKEYQTNDKYPIVLIQTVKRKTGERCIWNLKDESIDFNKYLDIVAASAAIPIYTNGIWLNDEEHYDGGLRDVVVYPKYVVENYNVSEIISVYSLPENVNINKYHKIGLLQKIFKFLRLTSLLTDILDIMVTESRDTDAKLERELSKEKNIKLTQYFLPPVLVGFYDVNKERLKKLYEISKTIKPYYNG